MLRMPSLKAVYPEMDLSFGRHIFPVEKYRLVRELLEDRGQAAAVDFVDALPATEADIRRVHTADYVEKMRTGRFALDELLRLEIPWSPSIVRAFWLMAGGAIQAARLALRDGCSVLLGGGFHHAFAGHGEGFCLVNDVAVAIAALREAGEVERVAIVDLDVHQGNGSASIFARDPATFTFSMHQESIYPSPKPASTLDIGLDDGVTDDAYLSALAPALARVFAWQPDLVLYLAGADPYERDLLGGLALTQAGLAERDRRVLQAAREACVPVAVVFAGGYAARVEETVRVHANTILTAAHLLAREMPTARALRSDGVARASWGRGRRAEIALAPSDSRKDPAPLPARRRERSRDRSAAEGPSATR